MINLGVVNINKRARENVLECLDNNEIGQGNFIEKFEKKVANYVGVKYAIATCNGSMADIIALASIKKNYYQNEVIVPALTFVAQTNAIIANGLKPVFVDIDKDFQMDVEQIKDKINFATMAIMPVHLLGKKCNIDKIIEIAGKIPVIEDCCEAFGVKPKQIGTYSFFPSHTITTGEGGMIITDNKELADLCKKKRNHGRLSEDILDKFHFDTFGFNGKMGNMTAAIGEGIVDETSKVINKRKENVKFLNKELNKDWQAQSPHCYPYICKTKEERDAKLIELYENGIEARKLFSCLPTQEEVYKEMRFEGKFPKAEDVGDRGLYLPIHQKLTNKDLLKICQIIKK